jgi:hypothetical protein
MGTLLVFVSLAFTLFKSYQESTVTAREELSWGYEMPTIYSQFQSHLSSQAASDFQISLTLIHRHGSFNLT